MIFESLPIHSGRELLLEQVERWQPYHKPMFYRSNNLWHSQRVRWLVESVLPDICELVPDFDATAARVLADRHDDAEIIVGDVQLSHKLLMTEDERAALVSKELRAYPLLFEAPYHFPRIVLDRDVYALFQRYEKLGPTDDVVALVKFADKIDAYFETLHELHAGNPRFQTDSNGKEQFAPHLNYPRITNGYLEKFTLLQKLQKSGHPFFQPITPLDAKALVANGKPHTSEGICTPTGHYPYDLWRNINLANGRAAMTEKWLTEQKEY